MIDTNEPHGDDTKNWLSVCGQELVELPCLSDDLRIIKCYCNQLRQLPLSLPLCLQVLSCDFNKLNLLPQLSHLNLIYLSCQGNFLTELPDLPPGLQKLNCSENRLTKMPILPFRLESLNCSVNNLSILDSLPTTLNELLCSHNQLTALPELPQVLIMLDCALNNITKLPTLASTSMQFLRCECNNLDTLPELPPNLIELICSYNYLRELPELPSQLKYLCCDHNNLTELQVHENSHLELTLLSCNDNHLTKKPKFTDLKYPEYFEFYPQLQLIKIEKIMITLSDNCSVCQDSYEETASRLPCGHIFHDDCIAQWFRIKHSCPICRHGDAKLIRNDDDIELLNNEQRIITQVSRFH